MSNHNITQRGTQATGLGVMISRCSPDSQHGRSDRHPTNVGCSSFRHINDDVTNHNEQRPKRWTWTREENQLALECYFRGNPSQRGYRKRMIEIWQERSTFHTTSLRLADQVRTITKKGWFSDLELLEIHQETLKQNYNTVPDTSSGVKQTIQRKRTANLGKWKHHTPKRYTTKKPGRNTITRTKGKSRKCKENHEKWKDYSTFIKKHRMENTQDRNE